MRGQAPDCGEGRIREAKSFGVVFSPIGRGGEPESQPSEPGRGGESLAFQPDWGRRDLGRVPGGPPVYELGFGYGEGDPLGDALERIRVYASCSRTAFSSHDCDAAVRPKSSTYEIVRTRGMSTCSDDTYMTNRRGDMGEPWGTPTWTGRKVCGAPWKTRRHVLSLRKEPIHAIRYGLTPFIRRWAMRMGADTLSNPPFISRNRVETLCLKRWRDSTWAVRASAASGG
jgi:hypothetical protein